MEPHLGVNLTGPCARLRMGVRVTNDDRKGGLAVCVDGFGIIRESILGNDITWWWLYRPAMRPQGALRMGV
jgi:hypothetical protein